MLVVGKVLKAHGIKGEIKVQSFLDTPDMLLNIKEIYIDNNLYKVQRTALNGSFVLYKLSGVDSVESAEMLRNYDIYAKKSSIVLPKDRYYIEDIIGCTVLSDQALGIVTDILQYGSADVYVVENNGKQIMFPFVEGVIEEINLQRKEIIVNKQRFLEVALYED